MRQSETFFPDQKGWVHVRISSNKLSPWSNQKEWKRRKNYSVIPCHSVSCTMLTFTLGTLLYFIWFCFCLFFSICLLLLFCLLFCCCCYCYWELCFKHQWLQSHLKLLPDVITMCSDVSVYEHTPQRTTLQKSTYSPTFFITNKDFNSAIHRPYFKFLTIITISHLP